MSEWGGFEHGASRMAGILIGGGLFLAGLPFLALIVHMTLAGDGNVFAWALCVVCGAPSAFVAGVVMHSLFRGSR